MVEYIKDKFVQSILDDTVKIKRYIVRDGLIIKRNRIFLTPNSKMKENVLHALHNIPRQLGILKMYKVVRDRLT